MEQKAVSFSVALHMGFLLIAAFGLPTLFEREQEWQPSAVSVEIVPIGELTNLPSKPKPISKPKKAPTPKNAKPTPKVKTEAPKETPVPKDAVPLPEPKEEKAEPAPEKPKEKPKEKSKKEVEDDFAVLMAKLRQESQDAKPEDAPKDTSSAEENTSRSDYAYDNSAPLSISERDAIRNQFIRCWRVPAGARDAADLAVQVRVKVGRNGIVERADLVSSQTERYRNDSFFRAAADSAIRAVWQCRQLQNLPTDKYSRWRDMELNFDPRELLY